MEIAARQLMWNGLPYAKQVEYIESSGTQWIDTGLYAGPNTSFSIDFKLTENQQEKSVFGVLSYPRYCIIKAIYYYRTDINDGSSIRYDNNQINRRTISYNSATDILTDSSYGTVGWDDHTSKLSSPTTDTIALFADKRDGSISSTRAIKMQLFSFLLQENSTDIMHLIPVIDLNGQAKMF